MMAALASLSTHRLCNPDKPFRRWAPLPAILVTLVTAGACAAQDRQVYYGLLHAHTMFSDGMGTPEEAFAAARAHGLDFFAVTEHNHAQAESAAGERAVGLMIAEDHRLFELDGLVTVTPRDGHPLTTASVVRAARDATDGSFVAGYGQEFSSISLGNHVNVLGYPKVLTNPNGDYRGMYEVLADWTAAGNPAPIVQLNHPDVHADLFYGGSISRVQRAMFNDYGFADYGEDFGQLVAATSQFVVLIEVLSGPAMAKRPLERYSYPRHQEHEADYYFYLAQGYHISPSVGHDNHYPTWGNATPARMGVWAQQRTQESLFAAMRENRTFATEDRNLRIDLSVNGSPMGSVLDLPPGEGLSFEVRIADEDEPDAVYEVTLVYGEVAPQTRSTLRKLYVRDGELEQRERAGDGAVVFDGYVVPEAPAFYYVRVIQEDGDRAWSGPVWVNHPREAAEPTPWVWTRGRSEVYHHHWCVAVGTIKPENRTSGAEPPEGRRLHGCRRPAVEAGH